MAEKESMPTKIHTAMLGAFFALLCGCSLMPERIDIQYDAQSVVAIVPGARNVRVQISDQRPDKSTVGTKENGYGMMAPILANEDVAVTIRKAIEEELLARGFQLGNEAAAVQIAGELTRFYNDHKKRIFSGGAVADMNMLVTVRSKSGGLLFSKQIVAQAIGTHTWLMTGNNARVALDRVLENGMKMLFEDQAFIAAILTASGSQPANQ